MKKIIYLLVLILFLFSCQSKPEAIDDSLEEIIEEPYDEEVQYIDFDEYLKLTEDIDDFEEEFYEDEPEEIAEEYSDDIIEEVEINNELAERIDDLEQQVIDLQEQLARLLESRQPEPPPLPDELEIELEIEPEQEIVEQQEEPVQSAFVAPPPPPPLPPVMETPPVPAPSGAIVVPREVKPEDPVWQPETASDVVFSRVVRATVGQMIEIPFRGTGWVYLGELASRRGVAYDSRRNDPDGMSFIFKAEEAGTYALKFSRRDFIRDYILNDHVQVIVGEAPAASAGWFSPPIERERAIAQPRWPSAAEEAMLLRGESLPRDARPASASGGADNENINEQTFAASGAASGAASSQERAPNAGAPREPSNISEVIQGTERPNLPIYEPPAILPGESAAGAPQTGEPSASARDDAGAAVAAQGAEDARGGEFIPVDQLITRAKEYFDAGNAASALALLDQFSARFPSGTDELYWLYGQFYEANTPSRNIKESINYYKKLTDEFPQSARYNDARRRIAYLERFYINIQ